MGGTSYSPISRSSWVLPHVLLGPWDHGCAVGCSCHLQAVPLQNDAPVSPNLL